MFKRSVTSNIHWKKGGGRKTDSRWNNTRSSHEQEDSKTADIRPRWRHLHVPHHGSLHTPVRRGKRSTYQCLYDHAAGSPCTLLHDVYAPCRLQRAGVHRCLQKRHAIYPFLTWGIHSPGHSLPHGLRPPGTHRSGSSRATAARHPASSQAQVTRPK